MTGVSDLGFLCARDFGEWVREEAFMKLVAFTLLIVTIGLSFFWAVARQTPPPGHPEYPLYEQNLHTALITFVTSMVLTLLAIGASFGTTKVWISLCDGALACVILLAIVSAFIQLGPKAGPILVALSGMFAMVSLWASDRGEVQR